MGSILPLSTICGDDHVVEFYEQDERLVEDVVTFAHLGLSTNEAVVIIATPSHRTAFELGLGARGVDVALAKREGRLFMEDAVGTLARFMVNGMPYELRFTQVVDGLLSGAGDRAVRAYGEMVNVLWQGGQRLPALRLEEFWCDAVKARKFPLLCAYHLDGFKAAEDTAAFRAICERHSKVRPVGQPELSDGDRHLRTIAELEQRARALESEVARRKALTEELEQANHRKSEFLAMLAHELRNPIAALSVGLALRDKLGPQDAGLERVKDNCTRQVTNLAHLVDDLLDVSRFTNGTADLRLRKTLVDLSGIVQNAVQASRAMLEARQHELTFTVAPGTFAINADPMRIEQILTNLLHNASKFTEPGGHIGLKIRKDGTWALIEITDDGAGIPPEMLSSVFELFTQLNPGLDRTRGGLGIGLTLARRLTELHEGQLTAESAGIGKGSKFTVRLPLAPSAPEAAVVTEPEPEAEAGLRRRVLLIEDNEDIRDSLKDLLEDLGHEVEVAIDGPSGLTKLLQMQPDVALIDVGLPGIDGYEVARRARAVQEGRGLYLVALTGYSGLEARRQAEQAGFDRYVVKPLKFEDLTRIIQPAAGLMH
jgi:signal transduction histidine kinase